MINIRKAILKDSKKVTKLILMSAPYFPKLFGNRIEKALKTLFSSRYNLFSYENVFIIEIDETIGGMILGYTFQTKKKVNLHTGFLLLKTIGVSLLKKVIILIRFNSTIGQFCKDEYYISNLTIYPRFREKGLGKKLIVKSEEDATKKGSKRIVLDVEKENTKAINFYSRMGYKKINEFSVFLRKEKKLQFYRMSKEI